MRFGANCVLLSFALSGCGSPEPKFYTLQRVIGPTEATGPSTIEVRRPALAGYLDRSEIVLKNDSYRISTNDRQRWAEPLDDMIGRILTQNLSQRLKNSSVYDQGGALTAAPDARVEVDIVSFNQDESGSVSLNAQVAIEQGSTHRALATRHVALQEVSDSSKPVDLVATMSALLGKLSDRIASDVRSSTALADASPAAPVAVSAATPAATPSASLSTPHADLPSSATQTVAIAANTGGLQAFPPSVAVTTPLLISPAPITNVATRTLPQPACESGGRAVPCLQAP